MFFTSSHNPFPPLKTDYKWSIWKWSPKSPRPLTCQTEKGTRTNRRPSCHPPGNGRDERTHNKFPHATRHRLAKEERCGSVGGLGSSTSRPQHLYHKSPQSSDGSFQSLGVSAMEKSHGLSASAGLSYFTRDSTSLSPSHSKLMLAFENNIFKISLFLSLCLLRGYFWICCCPNR